MKRPAVYLLLVAAFTLAIITENTLSHRELHHHEQADCELLRLVTANQAFVLHRLTAANLADQADIAARMHSINHLLETLDCT